MNSTRIVVKAHTKQEAIDQVEEKFQIMKDATTAYKNAGKPQEKDLVDFCNQYLAKTTKSINGAGCIITIEAGIADSRENPYAFNDIKNEKGTRVWKKGIQFVDRETNAIMGTCFGTKSEAKDMVKELYRNGYKGKLFASYIKAVVGGEAGAFEASYAPSKSSKLGTYICFGFPKDI